MAFLEVRNLGKTYVTRLGACRVQALKDVSFSVEKGEFIAVMGKSGGKLTLSGETAPIQGGFILKDGNVEVNCAFDTLVRLQKAETAGQVAQRLFG